MSLGIVCWPRQYSFLGMFLLKCLSWIIFAIKSLQVLKECVKFYIYIQSYQGMQYQLECIVSNAKSFFNNSKPQKWLTKVKKRSQVRGKRKDDVFFCNLLVLPSLGSSFLKLSNLNNYFDFHVCLSIRPSVRSSGSVRPKTNFSTCKRITKCN